MLATLLCVLLGHKIREWHGALYPAGMCDRCGKRIRG